MYKFCLLFVLHVLTTKIELSMSVRSLNIDLSNAAICILSCSSAFMKKDHLGSQGFIPKKIGGGDGGGEGGGYNHLRTLITPAVPYGYTRSWIPIHKVKGS